MYLASYIDLKFKTNENNFAGVRLDEDWGAVSTYFYGNKYYCSSDNTPYAYFENLEKSVEFLVTRWGLRMGNVTLDEKSITKFLILNPGANTLNENIYTTYDKTNLSTLESKVKKFDIFGRAIECFPNIFYLLCISVLSPTMPVSKSVLRSLHNPLLYPHSFNIFNDILHSP